MTRQFDVVANPDPIDAALRPYLLVLQSDIVSGLTSTVVAPLVPRDQMKGAQRGLAIGIVNFAEELHGAQVGLVNIAMNNPRATRVLPILNVHRGE